MPPCFKKSCYFACLDTCIPQQNLSQLSLIFWLKTVFNYDQDRNLLCVSVFKGTIDALAGCCCCHCAIFCLLKSSPSLSCQPSRGDAEWQAFLRTLHGCARAPKWVMRCDRHPQISTSMWNLKSCKTVFFGQKSCCPQTCGPDTAGPVLLVLQGRRCCCAGWKWHSPVRGEFWENLLWLLGLLCNCHGHCDTLWCVVSIAAFCLGKREGMSFACCLDWQ